MKKFGCLILLVLWTSVVALGDATDAMIFDSKQRSRVRPRVHTIVHYYRKGCRCCEDYAEELAKNAGSRTSIDYLPIYSVAADLPLYEIYGPEQNLIHSGERALLWLEANL